MVLCLLPCYHFFLFILLLLHRKLGEAKFSRRMGLMIGIEFRLSIFRFMKIYVVAKLDGSAEEERVQSD